LAHLPVVPDTTGNPQPSAASSPSSRSIPPPPQPPTPKHPHLDDDYLTLSTVHSAKELEWDAVHVISASDGNFPSDMALTSPGELEEERRLLYVALTRPCRTLAIYLPVRYYHQPSGHDDAHGYGKPSRFLTDQVQALCERINAHSTAVDQAPSSDQAAQPARPIGCPAAVRGSVRPPV
jgi:ATP-dependent exoDNAse (exonuclease V) beta subunit